MEKSLQFKHYEVTVRLDDAFYTRIRNQESGEIWDSGPHGNAVEAVNMADKGLLWYYEAYESRNCPERTTLRETLKVLTRQLEDDIHGENG